LQSIFSNALAIESILNRWTLIEKNTNIFKDFIGAIKLILSSTYFNSKIYRQTFGSPMGSPLCISNHCELNIAGSWAKSIRKNWLQYSVDNDIWNN